MRWHCLHSRPLFQRSTARSPLAHQTTGRTGTIAQANSSQNVGHGVGEVDHAPSNQLLVLATNTHEGGRLNRRRLAYSASYPLNKYLRKDSKRIARVSHMDTTDPNSSEVTMAPGVSLEFQYGTGDRVSTLDWTFKSILDSDNILLLA